jgi:hypothetical protein
MTGTNQVYTTVRGMPEIVRRQHGVVSRRQLRELGVHSQHVVHHLRALRWRALSPTVIVTHRGPLSRSARQWAAVLGAPAGSVIGAWTALELHGIETWFRGRFIWWRRGAPPLTGTRG